jgi:hypothetical protein
VAYLSAPNPPNETARLKAYQRTVFELPDYAEKAAQHLVALAVRVFQTESAALSFFDAHDEVMRAEQGYNYEVIPRVLSIGAHVLLSKGEPMILLDAQQVSLA